jgi:hypothetical protein
MLELISGALTGFMEGFASQTSGLIRGEVDYVANTLKTNIRDGIKDGLDAVRRTMFYLLIGVGATMVGLAFLIGGLALFFENMFKQPGVGFSVFGLIALLIGLVCFALSKPK